jgi:hypothetical protein
MQAGLWYTAGRDLAEPQRRNVMTDQAPGQPPQVIPLGPVQQQAPDSAAQKEIMPDDATIGDEPEDTRPIALSSLANFDPTNPKRVGPYIAPRRAALSMIPKRESTIRAPEPYQEVEVTFWINPSDAEIQARLDSNGSWAAYLAHFITRWNLKYEDGEMIAIDEDAMGMLPKELFDWMMKEFGEARVRPLVPPNNDTTGRSPTPIPTNRNRSPSSNGSIG